MHMTQRILAGLAISSPGTGLPRWRGAQAREEAKLLIATEVLEELRAQRDQQIPASLMQRAYGVAVVPNVTKAAFVFGGRFGSGVLSVRDSQGRFSNPVFINLAGGSVGWQIGVQETDIVLVFTTPRWHREHQERQADAGRRRFGGGRPGGPTGRSGRRHRCRGVCLFQGARPVCRRRAGWHGDHHHDSSNERVYGKTDVTAAEIISGAVTTNSENIRKLRGRRDARARINGASTADDAQVGNARHQRASGTPAAPPAKTDVSRPRPSPVE